MGPMQEPSSTDLDVSTVQMFVELFFLPEMISTYDFFAMP